MVTVSWAVRDVPMASDRASLVPVDDTADQTTGKDGGMTPTDAP